MYCHAFSMWVATCSETCRCKHSLNGNASTMHVSSQLLYKLCFRNREDVNACISKHVACVYCVGCHVLRNAQMWTQTFFFNACLLRFSKHVTKRTFSVRVAACSESNCCRCECRPIVKAELQPPPSPSKN